MQSEPKDKKTGFEGNLHLALPNVKDWQIEYYIDHEIANFSVDLSTAFDSVWFSDDVDGCEMEIPAYLKDWESRYINLMINPLPSKEDFEPRKTDAQLGFGWRGADDRFVIKIYLTRTEFRDVVDVLNQDHLRHGQANRDLMFRWLERHGIDPAEKLDDAFLPSETPTIRIDVKNTRLADSENLVNAEVWFDVCRIYA